MKIFAAIALAPLCILSGCASSLERSAIPAEPRSGLRIELTATTAASPVLPERVTEVRTPPRANRFAHLVAAMPDGVARTGLVLCIDGSGRVSKSEIATSSGISELDRVFHDDSRTWRYRPLAIRTSTACHDVEIVYQVR